MIKISVIVPVYKVEKFIYQCVDSVLNQTFTDFELILVDDGSPDNCGKICDSYAKSDPRIKVIHKANGGLSDARNFGINEANGEWLMFLDSDDWLNPSTLEKLYDAAIRGNVSLSVCGYANTTGESPKVDLSAEPVLISPKDLWLNERIIATIATAKLYRKDCFETIRFPVGRLHEDEFVTYRILFAQKECAFINQPYYAYYTNPDGITQTGWTPKRLDVLDAIENQLSFFKSLGDEELFEFNEHLYFLRLHSGYLFAKEGGYNKACKRLRRKVFKMAVKSPKKYLSDKYIWVLEGFFPKFMRFYWILKPAINKIFKKNKKL